MRACVLRQAANFVLAQGIDNVELARDDVFDSTMPEAGFDLVHARFQLAPLGRAEDQLDGLLAAVHRELARPDAWGHTFTLIQAAAKKTDRP